MRSWVGWHHHQAVGEIMAATHAGMTTDEFDAAVLDWVKTARHPRFDRPYTDLGYRPMLEVLAYLRANGFKYKLPFKLTGKTTRSRSS